MWCAWMCICVPYILTFLKCMWKICFKTKKAPTGRAMGFMMCIEFLHTCGLMLLLFIILPGMDVFRGIFIMNATSFFPSFLKMLLRPKIEKKKGGKTFADFLAFLFMLSPLVLHLTMAMAEGADWEKYKGADGYSGLHSEEFNNETGVKCYVDPPTTDEPTTTPDWNGSTLETTEATTTDFGSSTLGPQHGFFIVNMTRCGPGKEELDPNNPKLYLIPLALFLMSLTWWQNYVTKSLKMSCAKNFRELNKEVRHGKTKLFAFISIWKVISSFGIMLAMSQLYHIQAGKTWHEFTETFGLADDWHESSPFHNHKFMDNDRTFFEIDWLIVFGVNAGAGLVCHFISTNAIQAKVQRATFSVALLLSTPAAFIFALFGFCWDCTGNASMATAFNIDDVYWNCFDGFSNFETLIKRRPMVMLGVICWVGQMILGRHIWHPKSERLAKTGRIFLQPFYCGALLEQALMFNRSRHDKHREKAKQLPVFEEEITAASRELRGTDKPSNRATYEDDDFDEDTLDKRILSNMEEPLFERPDRTAPMIFVCATMWHETEKEMIQMIKSIIRLDKDQGTRRITRDYFKVRVPDYYDFEAHIFFDDAFNKYIPGDPEFTVNRFVALFVKIINDAASFVHQATINMPPPKKIPTPYGGRLQYILPGGNKLILHMKDKQKIRHKKRWSQVMYMYYLLGYRLWNTDHTRKVKEEVAYSTYILTLDGDVDFKPEAVIMLVDLMKRDFAVGAACGRIHPAGNGPLVWYQQFEYSISHWLQKSTEHILGCVLCSPGCFSLFRASALMDDNIMNTYSKTAEEASEFLQYDQGEDRWLCTLLLQRGYRVEYSAAADAMTYAPEGFDEFFNQRRRWTPSTFANVMDLLSSGRQTAKRNENISLLYIIYQGGMLVSSVLGPATIFLMTVGAFSSVFQSMSATGAFFMAFVPVAVFFALCMIASSGIQLGFAALLGGLFAIAQMVVLVGIIVGIVKDGLCGPTTWFLLMTTGIFVISAILHPQEFLNLLHGILYFLAIPTMYLLLIIYALCNLHVISWGTREVVTTKAEEEKLAERKLQLQRNAVATAVATAGPTDTQESVVAGVMGKLGIKSAGKGSAKKEDGWSVVCGDSCRCMCCPRPGESYTDKKISGLQEEMLVISGQLKKLTNLQTNKQDDSADSDDETEPLLAKKDKSDASDDTDAKFLDDASSTKTEEEDIPEEPEIDYYDKPYWTESYDTVDKGPMGQIDERETSFWVHLIKRYLTPIDQNPEREERIKKDLKSLRNKVVIGFFMIDVLFIALIQTLQTIPMGGGTPGSNVNGTKSGYYLRFKCKDPISKEWKDQAIEPIGFAFLIVFGLFLVIQFFGMLAHRLFSLIQIVASTPLFSTQHDNAHQEYVKLTMDMSKMDNEDNVSLDTMGTETNVDEDEFDDESAALKGKDAWKRTVRGNMLQPGGILKRLGENRKTYATMDKTFAQNFLALNEQLAEAESTNAELQGTTTTQQRRPSAFRRRMSSVFQSKYANQIRKKSVVGSGVGLLGRRKSVHANAMMDFARRRSQVVTEKQTQFLRNRFSPSERELNRARNRMSGMGVAFARDSLQDSVRRSHLQSVSGNSISGAAPTYDNIP